MSGKSARRNTVCLDGVIALDLVFIVVLKE